MSLCVGILSSYTKTYGTRYSILFPPEYGILAKQHTLIDESIKFYNQYLLNAAVKCYTDTEGYMNTKERGWCCRDITIYSAC